jgi:hypothetical protein
MEGIVLEADGIAYVVEPFVGTWFHGPDLADTIGGEAGSFGVLA